MSASYLRVGGCWWVLRGMLALYLRVGGCWEECVSLVPTCRLHKRGKVVLYAPFAHA